MKLSHIQLAGLVGLGAAIAGFAIQWAIAALSNGTISLPPALVPVGPLIVGVLTICGEWLHQQPWVTPAPNVNPPAPGPVVVPPPPTSGGIV